MTVNELQKTFMENCYNKLQTLDNITKYGVNVQPTRAKYIEQNPFLATQQVFEENDYYDVVITILKINPRLATQENFLFERKRCEVRKEKNPHQAPRYPDTTLEYGFLEVNPKLATQENFATEKYSSVREKMVFLNKRLATQGNLDNEKNTWVIRTMLFHNPKLATKYNFFKYIGDDYSYLRQLFLKCNYKLATKEAYDVATTDSEKSLIIKLMNKKTILNTCFNFFKF